MNIHTEECNIAFTRNISYSFKFCYEIFDTWHKTIYEPTTDFKNENITNSISLCSSLIYPPASLRVISVLNVIIPLLKKKKKSPHVYESLNHVFFSFNFFKVWFQNGILYDDLFTQHPIFKIHPYYYVKLYYIHSCFVTIS